MQASQNHAGSVFKRMWNSIVSLATNKYFSIGLLTLALLIAAGYFVFDRVLMPSYARYNVSVTVPNVTDLPIEDAEIMLQSQDLQVQVEPGRYNPKIPRNVVVDQNPKANMYVKPGRRIYLTINTGATPEVTVPSLEGISLTQAQNLLFAAGLNAEKSDIRPDSIPHPDPNLVTRQYPAPGSVVEEGSRVRLWYSTGLGDKYVSVPSVVGMTAREAQRYLLSMKLRSLVLGASDHPDRLGLTVYSQSKNEGTRLKEGYEIRLFVRAPEGEG